MDEDRPAANYQEKAVELMAAAEGLVDPIERVAILQIAGLYLRLAAQLEKYDWLSAD